MDVLDWMERPRASTGIRFAEDTEWSFRSYRDLAVRANEVAAALSARGLRRNDVAVLVFETGEDVTVAMYGAWIAGATVSIAPPPMFEGRENAIDRLAALFAAAESSMIVTESAHAEIVSAAISSAGMTHEPVIVGPDAEDRTVVSRTRPDSDVRSSVSHDCSIGAARADIALLQFTSGSTTEPKAVEITWRNLAADIEYIRGFTDVQDGQGTASWLPLHHDMGLIGGLLATVSFQLNLWLMRPDQFIATPMRWLECFRPGLAAYAPTPAFGLSYVVRRVPHGELKKLDLSGIRGLMVGAESLDPAALQRFARTLAPSGFDPSALMPAYGLAECTVAVAVGAAGADKVAVRTSGAIVPGRPLTIDERTSVGFGEGDRGLSAADGWMIGHRLPDENAGFEVRISDSGMPCPDGVVGEIVVMGDIVGVGYRGAASYSTFASSDNNPVARTGDLGFVDEKHLYVLGRMGHAVKINGRLVFAEDIDHRIVARTGVSPSRLASVCALNRGAPEVVVLAAIADTGAADTFRVADVLDAVQSLCGADTPVAVVIGVRSLITRTTSGKPRRRSMWQMWIDGEYDHLRLGTAGEKH